MCTYILGKLNSKFVKPQLQNRKVASLIMRNIKFAFFNHTPPTNSENFHLPTRITTFVLPTISDNLYLPTQKQTPTNPCNLYLPSRKTHTYQLGKLLFLIC